MKVEHGQRQQRNPPFPMGKTGGQRCDQDSAKGAVQEIMVVMLVEECPGAAESPVGGVHEQAQAIGVGQDARERDRRQSRALSVAFAPITQLASRCVSGFMLCAAHS